jgi:hypothetical protein
MHPNTPLLTLGAALLAASPSLSAQDWSSGPDLSAPRGDLAATSSGNLAFFAGGQMSGSIPSAAVDIYDAGSDAWSTAALSAPRWSLSATSVAGKVLFAGGVLGPPVVGGGTDGPRSAAVDVYDTTAGTWSVTSMSQARSHLAATSVNGYALFAGGYVDSWTPSDRVDAYDANTGTWSQASLSSASHKKGTTVGPYALFAGGSVIDVYDSAIGPPSNPAAWSQASISGPGFCEATVTAGGRAYFASYYSKVINIYDSTIGTPWDPAAWSVELMQCPRTRFAATAVGDTVLFGGGIKADALGQFGQTNHVEVFDAGTGVWSVEQFSSPRASLAATSVGDLVLFGGGGFSDRVDLRVPNDSPWKDLGHGSPWVFMGPFPSIFTPTLTGSGPLTGASNAGLHVHSPLGGSAFLILGFQQTNLPLFQGTLVPSVDLIFGPVPVGLATQIDLPWPAGLPSGFQTYWQAWITEPGFGWAATNGVLGTTP